MERNDCAKNSRAWLRSGDRSSRRRGMIRIRNANWLESISESRSSNRVCKLRRWMRPLPEETNVVRFGATVVVREESGEESTYRIVGVDETDIDRGWVSWLSPIAKTLMNARPGKRVRFKFPAGEEELEDYRYFLRVIRWASPRDDANSRLLLSTGYPASAWHRSRLRREGFACNPRIFTLCFRHWISLSSSERVCAQSVEGRVELPKPTAERA